jgi:DNA polymerase-3 subunit epsilon
MRQVFLDTETTGLSVEQGDRIVEIGCIEMVNRRLSGRTLHHYVNPGRSSHPDALKVHGLTDEFLAEKPSFAQIAAEIAEFIDGAELVIHNADFDTAFLNAEFDRIGHRRVATLVGNVLDSLALARELFPGKGNSLDALCKRLEVDNSSREYHGALLDAGLLAEVYLRMTRGQKALVIEAGNDAQGGHDWTPIDLTGFVLPVIEPTEDEEAAHAALLADLDKASGGATLYRRAARAAEARAVLA